MAKSNIEITKLACCVILISFVVSTLSKKFSDESKPEWAKKDITDYNDVDVERLLEQWEEDDDPLPDDELPEHLRPRPKLQFDPSKMTDPEALLKMSKKGQTVMMFVRVQAKFSSSEAEEITKRWQSSLWNNHIQAERYMIDDKRAIFMFKDGAQSWEAKDFLVEQAELQECTLENKSYNGKHIAEDVEDSTKKDEL